VNIKTAISLVIITFLCGCDSNKIISDERKVAAINLSKSAECRTDSGISLIKINREGEVTQWYLSLNEYPSQKTSDMVYLKLKVPNGDINQLAFTATPVRGEVSGEVSISFTRRLHSRDHLMIDTFMLKATERRVIEECEFDRPTNNPEFQSWRKHQRSLL